MALATAIPFAATAGTVNWTGGGDGVTFADPRNWSEAVQDGDSLVIENATSDTTLTLTNDLGSVESPFCLKSITATGAGAVHISGNPIEASGGVATNIYAGCALTTDFDIVYPNHASKTYVYCYVADGMAWTHNGSISAPGKTFLRLATSSGTFHIYGDMSFTNGAITVYGVGGSSDYGNNNSRWYFYGKCSTPKFNADGKWLARGATYHAYSGYDVGVLSMRCNKDYLSAPNVLKPTTIVESYTSESSGNLYIQDYDQTIDHLAIGSSIAQKSSSGHSIDGTNCTFTMKCSVDNTTNDFRFVSSVNAVWDPLGDYTCVFRERKHTTSGRIAVKRGTMAFLGETEFTYLSEVEIASGARFSPASATDFAPLPRLARLRLADSTAKISLPAGCTVSCNVFIGGVPQAAGTYTGTGGMADHVVPWIDGTGVITATAVADRYWSGATDTSWGSTANWTTGDLPPNGLATYITTPGTGPVVSGTDDCTFDLSGFANNTTTPSFTIDDGAVLSVTGGSLNITNICGKARIGGDSSVTSRVEVSGGVLTLHSADTRFNSLAIDKGGLLKLTGGETRIIYKHGQNSNREWGFRMLGGAFEMGDGAYASIAVTGGSPVLLFGTGDVRIGGNARLDFTGDNRAMHWTSAAEGESLSIDIAGNAFVTNTSVNTLYVRGTFDGTRTVVSVRENAVVKIPNSTYVGYARLSSTENVSTYGELNISGNAKVVSGTSGLYVANSGTSAKPSNGKVAMSGGELNLSGVNQNPGGDSVGGLAVGYNNYSGGFTNIDNFGVFELSGGTVKNTGSQGRFVVGEGNAKGDFVQTGGTFTQGSKASYIGWYGGIGRYAFSGNGTANFANSDVSLGVDSGKGTLEIGAGTGTFTAKTLSVAGAESALKFVLGADGSLATLAVNGAFTVDANAKLVIDATQLTDETSITLMTYGSRSGEFAAENIEIISARPQNCRVVQEGDKIRFVYKNSGLIIIFR